MEFVSGEIYYQAKLSRGLDSDEKLRPLFTFLESDLDSKIQKTQSRIALDRLKNLRRLNSTFYDAAIAHDSTTLQQYFDVLCRSALHEATYHGRRMTVEVAQLQESIDTELMERVLQYFSILKDELNTTCERLDEHSVNCTRKKHQAKRLRDIQIFSKHLEIETQGIVTCDLIPAGSSQWTRCGKAIKDNLCIPRLQSNGFCDVKVLNAFKVDHKLLSNKIQRAAGQIPTSGKVKGLFCSLSRNSIYSFCVYGLHVQANIVKSDNANNIEFNASFLADIFHLPWFSSELSGSTEVIRVTDKTNKEFYKDSSKYDNNDYHTEFGSNTETTEKMINDDLFLEYSRGCKSKPRGTAENLAKTNGTQYLRFCKYSNPGKTSKSNLNWKTADEDQLKDNDEGGNILTLCRVLLKKTLSIDDDITEEDVQNAFHGGYDSIYSKSREEYILLNPEYVLPEFCMHVQYLEDNDNYSSTVNQNESKFRSIASSSRKKVPNKVWIPSDLTYRNDESDSSQDHQSGSIIQNTSISRKVFSLLSDRDDIGKLLMKNKLATDDYENYIDRRTYEANIDEETEIFLKNTGESPQKNGNSSPCRKSKSADRGPSHSILRNKQMIVHDIENSTNYFNFERIKIFSLVIGSLQNFAKNFSLEADRLQNKS